MTSELHASVRKSTVSGNGLFADEDIPAGELILSIPRPLVGVLDIARLQDTCANCFTWTAASSIGSRQYVPAGTSVQGCTGCNSVKYCSKVG